MEEQELQRLKTLKRVFPEDSWSWAITALRQNPLIWGEFTSEEQVKDLTEVIGKDPSAWTPGRIGAALLSRTSSEEILFPVNTFDDLSADLKGKVHQTYQEYEENPDTPPSLIHGFFLALALMGEKSSGKSWQEILSRFKENVNWQIPLTILFNLVKDPAEYLRLLGPDLALQILLSNPLTPQGIVDMLVEVVSSLEIDVLDAWFSAIQKELPGLVSLIARSLLDSLDLNGSSIQEILVLSFLHELAGNGELALKLLEEADKKNQKLRGKVTATLNKVKTNLNEPRASDPSWQELKGSLADEEKLGENLGDVAEIIHSLLNRKQLAAISDLVEKLPEPLPEHPGLLLALADYAYAQDQTIRAEQLAHQAIQFAGDHPPEKLSSILLRIGMLQESARAAKLFLDKHPNHLASHLNYAEALRLQGDYQGAAQAAQILTVLFPQDLELQRRLAGYLEEAEFWQDALEVRAAILTKQGSGAEAADLPEISLPLDDLIKFAHCAFSARQYHRTVSACKQILAQNRDYTPALSLKGKALCKIGETEQGYLHLGRAVELSPDSANTWLTLAECQSEAGHEQEARQTLNSGLTSASRKSTIYYRLATLEAAQNNHSRALELFEKASASSEKEGVDQKASYQIQLGLGRSNASLGHLDQARLVLKELNDRFPANFEANCLYGKLLLENDQAEKALPHLIHSVDQAPENPEAHLYYADALLQIGKDPEAAAQALNKAIVLDPNNQIALVLLGEAQAAAGDFQKSMLAFQNARESSLMNDPAWAPRISAGVGKASLKLGETETAIAALKDGHDRFPLDLTLAHSLAEAYQAGQLTANALETAREAAEIAPQDPANLSWVASFTLELGSPEQGIASLKKLIRINPNDPQAYILLGTAQAAAGNINEAGNAFAKLVEFEDISPEDLLNAGDELIKLGQIEIGMICLQKAISICEANQEPSPLLPRIWSRQAAGLATLEDNQSALELLDKSISAELDNPEWRIQKADLLIKGDRHQAAIASLTNALDLSPGEPLLHLKLARVQSQIGDYEEAFFHAQEALADYQDQNVSAEELDAALALSADLAAGTNRIQTAEGLLEPVLAKDIPQGETQNEDRIHTLCLAAELALDRSQEVKAAEISNVLVSQHAEHYRVGALQARILNRQGSIDEARSQFESSLENWKNTPAEDRKFSTAVEIALGKTALEIQDWQNAAVHLQHAVDLSPAEKRALLALTNGYIILAENRRFFETFKVLNNCPSQVVLSSDVYQSFLSCVQALVELEVENTTIKTLQTRGEAIFSPSQESAAMFQRQVSAPAEKAALIAAYRHSRQKVYAAQTALDHFADLGQDARLDAEISLALLKSKPNQAYKAASSALEGAKRSLQAQIPLFFVLQAMAARRINDPLTAEESISKATQIWDNEPRWFALAAEMSQDYDQRIDCYKKAIELEPEHIGHYLALGNEHMKAKQAVSAVKTFEKALEINPENVDSWIQRALGKRAMQKMPDALESINQALSLAPEHKEARKTAALLAFENGSYRESERHLVSLLGQDPHDTELLALFARTLTAQKQKEEAMRVIDKAISLEDRSLDLRLQRASMIKQIEGPLAAIDELRIIGSHYPDQYPLIVELVATLAEAGEMDQAIRTALDILQDEEIDFSKEEKAHLYLTTGRMLRNTGQLDQAVHHLYKAKKLIEPNYDAVLELGRVHHDRRQYNLALEQIQNAIDIEPGEAEGYYQAGRVLKDLKKYSQAEQMLRKAAQLAPNDLKIHRQLGVLVTLNLVHGEQRQGVPA